MHKAHIIFLSNIHVLLFFFQHQTCRKIFKTSLELFKCSIKLWALDIFPVFTFKNQNCTENLSISLFPLYFGVFSRCCETYPIDFIWLTKVLRLETSNMKIVPNYLFSMEKRDLSDMNFIMTWNLTNIMETWYYNAAIILE